MANFGYAYSSAVVRESFGSGDTTASYLI